MRFDLDLLRQCQGSAGRMCGIDMRKISREARDDMKGLLRMAETVFEALILTLLYYVVWRMADPEAIIFGFFYKGKYVLMGTYMLLILVVFQNSDCTKFGQLRIPDLVIGQFIALAAVNFITYLQLCLIAEQMLPVGFIFILLAVEILAAVVLVLLYQNIYLKIYQPHDMLLVYGSEQGIVLKLKMDSRQDKYHVTELISADKGFDEICSRLKGHDSLILSEVPVELRERLLIHCYRYRFRVYVAPELTDIMLRGAQNNKLFDVPLFMVKGSGITPGQRIAKRAMDLVICSIAMIPLAPIMLLVALAIKLEDGGPVFYRQKRLTRNGREFDILKFRSMVVDAEKYQGAVLATDKDPRITKVGRFIRATRLDELPQLLNILKGDMSIVGPRPERKVLADEISKTVPEFDFRLKVRGGLTGYAQIFGKYNTSSYDKLRLDLMYIENYSLLMDIRLMILTVRILFSKDSTEGVDVAAENKRLAQQILREEAEKHKK